MRFIFFIGLCLLLTSCARMLNSRWTNVYVRSEQGVSISIDTNTQIVPRKWSREFIVKRDSVPLKITVTNDTLKREVLIRPILSRTTYLNIFNLGAGYLSDRHSVKQYTYPKLIWIGIKDTGNIYYKLKPPPVCMLSLNFSVPLINQFYVRTSSNEDRSNVGIFGITAGVNYWYRHQHFFSVQIGMSVAQEGLLYKRGDTIPQKTYTNLFLNVKHNHNFGLFDLGYGVTASHIVYEDYDRVYENDELVKLYRIRRNPWVLGLSLSGYYHIGKIVAIGLLYQPQLIEWNNELKFRYGHTINLDVMWRFPFNKNYRRN
jgi:hypothetical protein